MGGRYFFALLLAGAGPTLLTPFFKGAAVTADFFGLFLAAGLAVSTLGFTPELLAFLAPALLASLPAEGFVAAGATVLTFLAVSSFLPVGLFLLTCTFWPD